MPRWEKWRNGLGLSSPIEAQSINSPSGPEVSWNLHNWISAGAATTVDTGFITLWILKRWSSEMHFWHADGRRQRWYVHSHRRKRHAFTVHHKSYHWQCAVSFCRCGIQVSSGEESAKCGRRSLINCKWACNQYKMCVDRVGTLISLMDWFGEAIKWVMPWVVSRFVAICEKTWCSVIKEDQPPEGIERNGVRKHLLDVKYFTISEVSCVLNSLGIGGRVRYHGGGF